MSAPAAQLDDDREFLLDLLPKSAHKHVDEILDHFAVPTVATVETVGARVELDRVQAYGLDIGLDGYGNAVRVEFPYGAEVTEWA